MKRPQFLPPIFTDTLLQRKTRAEQQAHAGRFERERAALRLRQTYRRSAHDHVQSNSMAGHVTIPSLWLVWPMADGR
eukprot:5563422-Prymnesium_polylepis.2